MSESLYNRFIDAFTDENETTTATTNEKRSPLVSDEKLEGTFKTIQKAIQDGIHPSKTTDKQEEINNEKKSSRFQRWVVHYLKAPFQKWEGKKNEEVKSNIEQKKSDDESEEENDELNSSSPISETDQSDDEDDEDDDSSESDDEEQEEHSTITEKIKQGLNTVQNLAENVKSKVCFIFIKYMTLFKSIYIRYLRPRMKIQTTKKKKKKSLHH
jgi:hypothetical protein